MPLEYNDPRLKYVTAYLNKHYPDILCDDETGERYIADSSLIDVYLTNYDKIIASLPKGCTEENYKNNQNMQKCLQALELDSEAFWKFLVLLYHIITQYYENTNAPLVTIESELKRLGKFLYNEEASKSVAENMPAFFKDDHPDIIETKNKAKIVFSLPRLKIEITDKYLLGEFARILLSMNGERTKCNNLMIPCNHFRLSLRAASYWVLKTLSEELPINRPDNVKLINKEMKLYLCILELCKYNNGTNIAHKKNYIIIRRLFKEYKDFDTSFPNLLYGLN